MTVVAFWPLALLGSAAAIKCSCAFFRGPTNLDRIVAAEILMVIVIAGIAAESACKQPRRIPLLLILGLVGFVGGVAVTRFMSRDVDDLDVEGGAGRPVHPTAPTGDPHPHPHPHPTSPSRPTDPRDHTDPHDPTQTGGHG